MLATYSICDQNIFSSIFIMGVFNDDTKIKLSGAGVLIVEEYRHNNLVVPCILVVRNRSSKELSDFGGTFDSKHSHISDTASAELLEESRNLIKIPADVVLRHSICFDIGGKPSYSDHKYRVYVIKAQNIASKYYNLNKQIIDADPNSKNYFKETDLIAHIPISNIDFDTLLDRKSIYIKDVHNKSYKISMRLRKILSTGRANILNAIKTEPIITSADLVRNTGKFERTYSFVYSNRTEKN